MNKNKITDALVELSDHVKRIEHSPHEANGIDRAIHLIEQMPDDGWISVEERPPSEDEFCQSYIRNLHAAEFIVMLRGADRPTTLYLTSDGFWKTESGEVYDSKGDFWRVIAWMPLPEAYKPEGV